MQSECVSGPHGLLTVCVSTVENWPVSVGGPELKQAAVRVGSPSVWTQCGHSLKEKTYKNDS